MAARKYQVWWSGGFLIHKLCCLAALHPGKMRGDSLPEVQLGRSQWQDSASCQDCGGLNDYPLQIDERGIRVDGHSFCNLQLPNTPSAPHQGKVGWGAQCIGAIHTAITLMSHLLAADMDRRQFGSARPSSLGSWMPFIVRLSTGPPTQEAACPKRKISTLKLLLAGRPQLPRRPKQGSASWPRFGSMMRPSVCLGCSRR